MASTCFRFAFRKLQVIPAVIKNIPIRKTQFSPSRRFYCGLLAAGVALSQSSTETEDDAKQSKLEVPDPESWKLDLLLRNTSCASVEASAALLTYATIGLTNLEQDCTRAIYTLIKLMEVRLDVLGKAEEEKICDLILETRHTLDNMQRRRKDMEMLFHTSQRLLTAAAEASYLAGSEYSSVVANEKINSSGIYIKSHQNNRMMAETELWQIEAKTVEVETKHAEDNERRKNEEKEREAVVNLTSDNTDIHVSESNTDTET